MKCKIALSALVLATVWLPSVSVAASLNFDALPASTNLSGAPNNPASVISTGLNNLGIVFGQAGLSTGVAVINGASGAFSDPQAIAGLDSLGNLTTNAAGDIFFRFVTPGTLNSSTTNFVTFKVGDDGGDVDSFTIRAYDLGGNVINTQMLSGSAHQTYSLNLADVHRIWVQNTTGTTFGYALDDLQFNDPVSSGIPEPSALTFTALGFAALAFLRRRGNVA